MEHFVQDLRFALRQLIHHRATSTVAMLTLALGIGANTSMFTLMNATLFRQAPAEAPDRLAWVTASYGRSKDVRNMSYPDYVDIRNRAKSFSGVLGFAHVWLSLGGTEPERIRGLLVTGNYFEVLGVHAARGRTFRTDEDGAPGAHPVAVLSDNFWKRRFDADPAIVDKSIIINGRPFTVVGVAPPGFGGIEINDDEPQAVWLPIAMVGSAQPGWEGFLTDRESSGWLRVMGRLATGATRATANAELAVIGPELRPGVSNADDKISFSTSVATGGLDPSSRSEVLPILGLLMVVPALVLLVACANAANVLLARGMARRKEIAVRRALGASRARLMRQLLTESVLLALAAGVIGVLLSFWMTGLIANLGDIPAGIVDALTPDRNVMIATTLLACVAGILFGFAPALTATSTSLAPALKNEGVALRVGPQRHGLRDVFVVGQVAVSLVLLVTAGLFARSLSKALSVDPGYAARSGVYLSFDLGRQGYSNDRQLSFERDLLAKVRGLPGVEAAALASTVPFGGSFNGGEAHAEGASESARGVFYFVSSVTPEYFDVLRVAFAQGRHFTNDDNATSAAVAIVNETMARRLWPNQDAIGKRIRLGDRLSAQEPWREVVGVVRDGKYANLTEAPRPYLYLPQSQRPASALVLAVRTSVNPTALLGAVGRVTRSIDPDLPLFNEKTFDQLLHGAADKQQATSSMLAVFGALALVLAALGMASVTAHGVAQRTREIGIRMSLGARASDVLAMFVREGLGRSLVGVATGLALSVALSKVLAGFLFGLAATDALTFASGAATLIAVAVVANYVPARRATRVDPMAALRSE